MKYLVLASLYDDLNQGWIWITSSGFEPRSIVKIKNKKSGDVTYCECLKIDKNYRTIYNNPPRKDIEHHNHTITMNQWYRKRLGIAETNYIYDLEIKPANCFYGKLRANFQHPQIVVRLATLLALFSIILGILSMILGIISICKST